MNDFFLNMYYNNVVVFMGSLFNDFYYFIMGVIDSLGIYGPLFASFLIIFESIIPPLPLFIFITINFLAFGNVLGFIISWVCTCIGCVISYFLVQKCFSSFLLRKIKDTSLLHKWINYLRDLSLVQITVILAIPFTPAFMMNITAGLIKMDFKKFLIAILISKLFLVYFWGFVGTGLVDSLHDSTSIITVIIMVVVAFILSNVIKKVFKIN